MKHSANSVGDGAMATFHRTILVGCIGASRTDIVVVLIEYLANLGVVIQFPSLIEKDVLLRDLRRVMFKEMP